MAALQQSVPRDNPGQGPQDPYNPAPSTPGAPGIGVPAGGTTGQALLKNSNTDFDTKWGAAAGGAGVAAGFGISVAGVFPALQTISSTSAADGLPFLSYVGGFQRAYGLRLMNIAYFGPLIHVKRTGDPVGIDIYPAAGAIDLDWSALVAYAAGADVIVDTIYEQNSGPSMLGSLTICIAGALIPVGGTVSGRYMAIANGTSQAMNAANSTSQSFTRSSVFNVLALGAGKDIMSDGSGLSLNMPSSGSLAVFAGTSNQTVRTGLTVPALAAVAEIFTGPSTNVYFNGTNATVAATPGTNGTAKHNFGGGAGSFLNAGFMEVIYFPRRISDFEAKFLYNNQKTYWGVP